MPNTPTLRSAPASIKKVVVHLGMPKAASTSIQLALLSAQDMQLTQTGLWFTPPNGETNDAVIYDLLIAGDLVGVEDYVLAKMEAGAAAGADIVIFSAERLFTIDHIQQRMAQLSEIFRTWQIEFSLCLVLRQMQSFLKSYIVQQFYSGQVTFEDTRLATWAVGQIRAIAESGFVVNYLSLNQIYTHRNIVEELVWISTGRDVTIVMPHVNITPSRPNFYALAEGIAVRIRAVTSSYGAFSPAMDQLRTTWANTYDEIIINSTNSEELWESVSRLDKFLLAEIEHYIDVCCYELTSADIYFYNNLLHA